VTDMNNQSPKGNRIAKVLSRSALQVVEMPKK